MEYVIKLIKDEPSALLEEYMRFLQHYCTYKGISTTRLAQWWRMELPKAMACLARKYAFPESEIESNVWVQKMEQCRLLKGKTLFQFAVCDIAMMTEEPEKTADVLLKSLPDIINESDWVESERSVSEFYDKCTSLLDEYIANREQIEKCIETNNVDDIVEMVEIFVTIKDKDNFDDIKKCLLYLDKMLALRLKHGISIVAQKLLEFKTNGNDFEVLYGFFGYPVIIRKDQSNNLADFKWSYDKCRGSHISSFKIKNFGNIESLYLELGNGANVIIGENGSGKSTIVNALRHLMSCLTAKIQGSKRLPVSKKDFKNDNEDNLLEIHLENGFLWKITPESNVESNDLETLSTTIKVEKTNIPIVAYYGASRVVSKQSAIKKTNVNEAPTEVYSLSKQDSNGFKPLLDWYSYCYENRKHQELEIVREAVKSVLYKYSNIYFSKQISLAIDNYEIKFDELSEGDKCRFTLVADIARRLIIANPELDNPLIGEGIIFIDEIDLHLHPNSQIDILEKFKQIFPNCQFIVTTNSPFVVSNVQTYKGDRLIHISGSTIHSTPDNVYGEKVDNMLTEFFNAKTLRNNEVQKHIDRVWSAFSDGDYKLEHAADHMKWLQENVESDDIEFVRIKFEQLKQEKYHEENK